MSDIFVSYKREDDVLVLGLVRALEEEGFSVWWDRGLVGGQNWRAEIESELDLAKCVVVVWTENSVGPGGDFVRDEAGQAKRRGVLLPVKFGNVDPPLGFREVQTINLANWTGRRSDVFFQDMVEAIKAKIEGRDAVAARGPTRWLTRRRTFKALVGAAVSLGGFFAADSFRIQERTCGVAVWQPAVSDICGALWLGGRPAKRERLAWEGRKLGDCSAIRAHLERFPRGAYRDEAHSLLDGRSVTQRERWLPAIRRLTLFEPQGKGSFATVDAAKAASLARAQSSAERLCRGFEAASSFRLQSARPIVQSWDCAFAGGGTTCSLDGEAVCDLEERRVEELETCGN